MRQFHVSRSHNQSHQHAPAVLEAHVVRAAVLGRYMPESTKSTAAIMSARCEVRS